MIVQPLLGIQHSSIPVIGRCLEYNVRCLAVHVPLEEHKLGDRLRCRRPDVPGDQVEHQVVPRRRGARHDEFLALSRGDQNFLEAKMDIWKVSTEGPGVGPVNCGIAAVEETCFGKQQNSGTG